MASEELINKGIILRGKQPPNSHSKPRTIIVLGVARGGTSLVAGALHHLGLYMGKTAVPPVFEDMTFDDALAARKPAALQKILSEYNAQHKIWGLKRPDATLKQIDKVHRHFRNPIYVAIFRDVLSIAKRDEISMHIDPMPRLIKALDHYQKLLLFLRKKNPPCLMVSYSKALEHKEFFLEQLIDFCGLQPGREQLAAASQFIKPNPQFYLRVSRVTLTAGRLETVSKHRISGWAKYVHLPRRAKAPQVALYIDDTLVAQTNSKKGAEPAGADAPDDAFTFEFTGFNPALIRPGAVVRVKVVDDVLDLQNSPYTVL
ncbi:MAG: hypothetical protein ACE5G8_02935 [Anaerolineae bacterium]